MIGGRTAVLLGAIAVSAAMSVPAAVAQKLEPLAAGEAVRREVLEGLAPFARWQVGDLAIGFGRTEVRRIGDHAHVRTVVTKADGTPIDPEAVPWIHGAARPTTVSGVLVLREGRWLLLEAGFERAETEDPDAGRRRWALPEGLVPPICEHRQNWGCGSATP